MCGSGFHWEVGAGARLGVFAYMEQLPQKKKKAFYGKILVNLRVAWLD